MVETAERQCCVIVSPVHTTCSILNTCSLLGRQTVICCCRQLGCSTARVMMMMISALPLGRSVMTPVVESQCHLNLGSEMRDDDEVVSRCLPQQATVC